MSKVVEIKDLPIGTKIIIFIFLLSGSFHLINPGVFQALVPPILGMQNFWIIDEAKMGSKIYRFSSICYLGWQLVVCN